MWHNLAHKNVPQMQLKRWMQCMQCEFFRENLVLVDLKEFDAVGAWGSNPHAPTNSFNYLRLTSKFSVTPNYTWTSTLSSFISRRVRRYSNPTLCARVGAARMKFGNLQSKQRQLNILYI
jgi:hypothetical protein